MKWFGLIKSQANHWKGTIGQSKTIQEIYYIKLPCVVVSYQVKLHGHGDSPPHHFIRVMGTFFHVIHHSKNVGSYLFYNFKEYGKSSHIINIWRRRVVASNLIIHLAL